MKIEIEITSCKQCPHCYQERHPTENSWDETYNWFCQKSNDREIAKYIEWVMWDEVKIPEWCPFKLQQKEILTVKKYKL